MMLAVANHRVPSRTCARGEATEFAFILGKRNTKRKKPKTHPASNPETITVTHIQ
jgi:hypothetical protein